MADGGTTYTSTRGLLCDAMSAEARGRLLDSSSPTSCRPLDDGTGDVGQGAFQRSVLSTSPVCSPSKRLPPVGDRPLLDVVHIIDGHFERRRGRAPAPPRHNALAPAGSVEANQLFPIMYLLAAAGFMLCHVTQTSEQLQMKLVWAQRLIRSVDRLPPWRHCGCAVVGDLGVRGLLRRDAAAMIISTLDPTSSKKAATAAAAASATASATASPASAPASPAAPVALGDVEQGRGRGTKAGGAGGWRRRQELIGGLICRSRPCGPNDTFRPFFRDGRRRWPGKSQLKPQSTLGHYLMLATESRGDRAGAATSATQPEQACRARLRSTAAPHTDDVDEGADGKARHYCRTLIRLTTPDACPLVLSVRIWSIFACFTVSRSLRNPFFTHRALHLWHGPKHDQSSDM